VALIVVLLLLLWRRGNGARQPSTTLLPLD
jgi:hypothetical protein